MTVKISNDFQMLGKTKSNAYSYKWKAYVETDDNTLDKIDCVTYILHPTFTNPIIVISDRSTKFALDEHGYGEFNLRAKIKYKDGHEENVEHWIKLSKKGPTLPSDD